MIAVAIIRPANPEIAKPIFCPDCRSVDSYKELQGIKSVSGTLLWRRWGCVHCGRTTIRPIRENFK